MWFSALRTPCILISGLRPTCWTYSQCNCADSLAQKDRHLEFQSQWFCISQKCYLWICMLWVKPDGSMEQVSKASGLISPAPPGTDSQPPCLLRGVLGHQSLHPWYCPVQDSLPVAQPLAGDEQEQGKSVAGTRTSVRLGAWQSCGFSTRAGSRMARWAGDRLAGWVSCPSSQFPSETGRGCISLDSLLCCNLTHLVMGGGDACMGLAHLPGSLLVQQLESGEQHQRTHVVRC